MMTMTRTISGDSGVTYTYNLVGLEEDGTAYIVASATDGNRLERAPFYVTDRGSCLCPCNASGFNANPFSPDGCWPLPPEEMIREAQKLAAEEDQGEQLESRMRRLERKIERLEQALRNNGISVMSGKMVPIESLRGQDLVVKTLRSYSPIDNRFIGVALAFPREAQYMVDAAGNVVESTDDWSRFVGDSEAEARKAAILAIQEIGRSGQMHLHSFDGSVK